MADKLTGHIGIYLIEESGKYRVSVFNREVSKKEDVGIFDNLEDAIKARNDKEVLLGYRGNNVTYFGHTKDELEAMLFYDEYTGLLHWKPKYDEDGRLINGKFAEKPITYKSDNGFYVARIPYKGIRRFARCHRIIWVMHYDELPDGIFHKDENKENNRVENLTMVDPNMTHQNRVDLDTEFVAKTKSKKRATIEFTGKSYKGFMKINDEVYKVIVKRI